MSGKRLRHVGEVGRGVRWKRKSIEEMRLLLQTGITVRNQVDRKAFTLLGQRITSWTERSSCLQKTRTDSFCWNAAGGTLKFDDQLRFIANRLPSLPGSSPQPEYPATLIRRRDKNTETVSSTTKCPLNTLNSCNNPIGQR